MSPMLDRSPRERSDVAADFAMRIVAAAVALARSEEAVARAGGVDVDRLTREHEADFERLIGLANQYRALAGNHAAATHLMAEAVECLRAGDAQSGRRLAERAIAMIDKETRNP